MYDLRKITVVIKTAQDRDADTDGAVYLGIAGREFRCDTSHDDFERGSTGTYVFGTGTNVQHPHDNDPNKPPLNVSDVDLFPAYIRFRQGDHSEWLMADAKVWINDEPDPRFVTDIENNPIWLGYDSGDVFYLRRPKKK